jgi:hypothetical protein
MMIKKLALGGFLLSLASLAYVLAPSPGEAQDPDVPKAKLADFMQMKLEYSKEILAGLTMEDHERVAKNAQALRLLSLETNWNVLNTEAYLDHSRDFRSSTKVILEAAREKNVERATLGYVAMTVRCVECHSYLRKSAK